MGFKYFHYAQDSQNIWAVQLRAHAPLFLPSRFCVCICEVRGAWVSSNRVDGIRLKANQSMASSPLTSGSCKIKTTTLLETCRMQPKPCIYPRKALLCANKAIKYKLFPQNETQYKTVIPSSRGPRPPPVISLCVRAHLCVFASLQLQVGKTS